MKFRFVWLAVAALALAGCVEHQPFADDSAVEAARYSDPENPSLTLFTMVNNRTGKGGHSALLINASERVIFDPAGSFYADMVPERNDVLFGISPRIEQAYRSAHARKTFRVVRQTVPVTTAQAETAYRLALARGPVPGAFCASATSDVLGQVPGLDAIRSTLYPIKLQEYFAALPGVVTDTYYEGDSEDLQEGLAAGNVALNSGE